MILSKVALPPSITDLYSAAITRKPEISTRALTICAVVYALLKLNRWRLERKWAWADRANGLSVKDKIVLITGANTGMGREAAKQFAELGATVILACRDAKKGEAAVNWIRRKTSLGKLFCMELDLSSLESIREFAKTFQANFSRLDILVNNAGIWKSVKEDAKTEDGFEAHMGVHHLGHFLLTNLLLDELKKGAPSRIITISTELYYLCPLDIDDLMSEVGKNQWTAPWANILYFRSKMANLLFSQELARRLQGTGVNAYAVSPGLTATDLHRNSNAFLELLRIPVMYMLRSTFMKTPEQGVATAMYCALSKDLANESGEMYGNCGRLVPSSRAPLREDDAKKLWDQSAGLVGL